MEGDEYLSFLCSLILKKSAGFLLFSPSHFRRFSAVWPASQDGARLVLLEGVVGLRDPGDEDVLLLRLLAVLHQVMARLADGDALDAGLMTELGHLHLHGVDLRQETLARGRHPEGGGVRGVRRRGRRRRGRPRRHGGAGGRVGGLRGV